MKIKQTIKSFNALILLIDEYLRTSPDNRNHWPFRYGICYLAFDKNITLADIFQTYDSYYKNYVSVYGYLKGMEVGTRKGWKQRLKFLKQEVIELNKLLKQGYTDI